MPESGILDASGHLVRPVTPDDLAVWKSAAMRVGSPAAAATARIDIGDYMLVERRQPDQAITEFDSVPSIGFVPAGLVEQSRYDHGLALWAEGAYRECTDTFAALSKPTSALPETKRQMAALWYRAAASCAEYHAGHAAMGIQEPPKLDPFCGDSALVIYLRSVGKPYEKQRIAAACKTTGEGNSFGDLITGGKALGIAVQYPGAGADITGPDTVNYPAYDSDGNLLTRIDGNSVETDYLYDDPTSLLTYVSYPSGTIAPVTHTYDAFGRHAGMTDGVFLAIGTAPGESFAYDDLDNVTTKTVNYSTTVGGLEGLQVAYTYNPDGSRASMTVPTYNSHGSVPGTFDYIYDDDSRQIGETDSEGNTFSWTYLDNSWLGSQLSENSAGATMVDTVYGYDARGELTDLRNYKTGLTSMWSEFGGDGVGSDPLPMTYDASGNRLSMPASEPDYSTYSGTVDYTYDYKNELTSEASTRNGGSGLPVDNAFDYDGNFTELRGASVSAANMDDQLTASGDAYDGNGNPTSYNGATLAYDPENRLIGYASGGTTDMLAGYGYDGLRAWRRANGATIYYLYDGMDPVVQLSNLGVVNAANDFGANGLIARTSNFFYPAGDYNRYYAFDPQGNTAEMIATNGTSTTLLLSATYDAFGRETAYPTTYTGDAYSAFGAQWGYFADQAEPLELLGHRYYDAGSGRFVTRDPIGYDGGVDIYGYAADRPVEQRDPWGLSPDPDTQSVNQTALGDWEHLVRMASMAGVTFEPASSATPTCQEALQGLINDCGMGRRPGPKKCSPSDTPAERQAKETAFMHCIRLQYIWSGCMGGPDSGHQEKIDNWFKALCKCMKLPVTCCP